MSKLIKYIIRAGTVATAACLALMVACFFISGQLALYLFGAALTMGVSTALTLAVWAWFQRLDEA